MQNSFLIANSFILKAKEENIDLSPMKLQKLIFLLYGYHLSEYKQNLIDENFGAWKRGPVLYSIWKEFRHFKHFNIERPYIDKDNKIYELTKKGDAYNSFVHIWNKYKNKHAFELSNMTHEKDTAWHKAIINKSNYLNDEDIIKDFQNGKYE